MPERQIAYTPVIVTCKGAIYTRPRIVTRGRPQEVRQYLSFVMKFRKSLFPEQDIEYLLDESHVRRYESSILSTLDAEGVYTDEDGVIQIFDKPGSEVWWVELEGITTKALKPVYCDPAVYITSAVGPLIDQVLETPPVEVIAEEEQKAA